MKSITVHAEPIPKARPRLAKGRIFTPRTTELAEWQIRETWQREHGDEPSREPLVLNVAVYLRQPANIPKKRRHTSRPAKRPDIDNYVKTVLDALSGVAYVDDAQVVDLAVSKHYAVDSPPRWEISIGLALPESSFRNGSGQVSLEEITA